MFADLVLMEKEEQIEKFTGSLGFNKIFFKEDFKKLKIEYGDTIDNNRRLIESRKIKILLNPHAKSTKDKLKERNTGLNQVILELAKKNKVMIALSLDQFSSPESLGRIISIIKLCRKYKIKICVFSLAKSKYEIKSVYDIISLLKISGMTPGEAKLALNNVLSLIE